MNAFKHRALRRILLCGTVLSAALILELPDRSVAQVEAVVSCDVAPPELPVFAQPPMPQEGYVWTPGYWQWVAPTGYYWVPGTWVLPPAVYVFWTPPYWGWAGGLYVFHGGYWGPHVGFYGGVNYGYGYGGSGYQGGRWEGGHFAYNSAVNNFGSVRIANAYRQNVADYNDRRVSYNGGSGGIRAEPSAEERSFQNEPHLSVTAAQSQHIAAAALHPGLGANTNHGRPQIAATQRPGQFQGHGVVAPRDANAGAAPGQRQPMHQAAIRPAQQHAGGGPPAQRQQPRQAAARPQQQQQHAAVPHQAQQQHAAAPHQAQLQEARR